MEGYWQNVLTALKTTYSGTLNRTIGLRQHINAVSFFMKERMIMKYQLEIKQIVDFPRCRIYRNFIQTLIKNKNIRTTGGSYLFWYLVLCSYANYNTSRRRMEQLTYTLAPGEWICTTTELQRWFRCKFQYQAITILKALQEMECITFSMLEKNRIVKFRITDWYKDNTVKEYNYPCKKDTGFFFFPISKVHKLIHSGKCSEMDILLDLWVHAVYNDSSVLCSDTGPVVYYRNNTGSPLTSFHTLGERWGHSKPTVSRLLKKLEKMDLITLISFRGNHGSMIYLNNYLSTMFNVSDVLIDKEEIAMKMKLPINIPSGSETNETTEAEKTYVPETVMDEQITVSKPIPCVPISHIRFMVRKVAKLLDTQGIPCCHCSRTKYILSPLSDCKDSIPVISLNIICPFGAAKYQFEMTVEPYQKSMTEDELSVTSPLNRPKQQTHWIYENNRSDIPDIILPDPRTFVADAKIADKLEGGENYEEA